MKVEEIQSYWCLDCGEAFSVYQKPKCCPYCQDGDLITMEEKQARISRRIDGLQRSIRKRRQN